MLMTNGQARRVSMVIALAACTAASTLLAQPSTDTPAQQAQRNAPAGIVPMDDTAAAQLRQLAIDTLINYASNGTPELRANAMEGLIPLPSRLEPVARKALVDANAGVKAVGAMATGRAGLVSLAPFVQPLLSDPSPMVRSSAIFAMGKLASTREGRGSVQTPDPSPLATMLTSTDTRERSQAAFVLGELGNKSAIPMLREALKKGAARATPAQTRIMQLQISEAIAKLGDDAALGDLRGALFPAQSEDLEVAALASQIVGQVEDRQSVGQLSYLVTHNDPREGRFPAEVRLAAGAAMAKLGEPGGSKVADDYTNDPSPAIRAQAALTYGEGARDNLSRLAGMVSDPEAIVRIAAAAAVLKITDRGNPGR